MSESTTVEAVSESESTRARLLTVAERLLLESGYDAVSVRAINTAAGMNPAAVHYHFGSKDALVAALLEDRLAPIWQDALDLLERRRRDGRVPCVPELVDVILGPLGELAADPVGRLRLHLLARVVLGGHRLEWTSRWFGLRSWTELLRAARPGLSEREATERWSLAFQLVLQFFGDPLARTPRTSPLPLGTLRGFVIAGLAAA
ncbi:helix-turn-helix domain containing protein [Amycolatopsis cynarae]|uniref:Helix-turn-helix domain containing protein n=1 Tax=Amycolatopsis cynarae TaxID=2995223 RepID=A0ABY7BAR9_9PSEU|nr:TetR/AcrR family transcriptional regulator [Amycolatopsis sp. HUAS 11-8]WAL69445.1 helix-turn-helix domain containing protein [Amycolatopsis sp. HUAS 11-8]